MATLQTGTMVWRKGFFTEASWLRSQTTTEVEQLLGYRSGRLSEGWYLLFMTIKPTISEFELRGYSHMSGGVEQGHLQRPGVRRNVEEKLRQDGYNLAVMKKNLIDKTFCLSGNKRLAKVVAVRGEFDTANYPPGKSIPQWELTVAKPFKVAAFIPSDAMYLGDYT